MDIVRRTVNAGLSPVTEDNRAGELWIIAILCVIYSAFAAALRVRIKWSLLGFDDLFTIAGFLFQIAQISVIFQALRHGLGQANSNLALDAGPSLGRLFLISEAISIIAICCAKCSILCLLLRIFTVNVERKKITCVGLLVLTCVWGIGALAALLVSCDPTDLLAKSHDLKCPSQFVRWQFIAVFDMTTELMTIALPIWLAWSLQMSRATKIKFVVAFAFRSGSIVLSAFHLSYFQKYLQSESPILSIIDPLLFQQAMISWSLISATIPNLKAFMKSFSTGMGWTIDFDGSTYDRGNSGSYPLQSMRSGNHPSTTSKITAGPAEDQSDTAGDRHGSQELIITKDIAWTVTHTGRAN